MSFLLRLVNDFFLKSEITGHWRRNAEGLVTCLICERSCVYFCAYAGELEIQWRGGKGREWCGHFSCLWAFLLQTRLWESFEGGGGVGYNLVTLLVCERSCCSLWVFLLQFVSGISSEQNQWAWDSVVERGEGGWSGHSSCLWAILLQFVANKTGEPEISWRRGGRRRRSGHFYCLWAFSLQFVSVPVAVWQCLLAVFLQNKTGEPEIPWEAWTVWSLLLFVSIFVAVCVCPYCCLWAVFLQNKTGEPEIPGRRGGGGDSQVTLHICESSCCCLWVFLLLFVSGIFADQNRWVWDSGEERGRGMDGLVTFLVCERSCCCLWPFLLLFVSSIFAEQNQWAWDFVEERGEGGWSFTIRSLFLFWAFLLLFVSVLVAVCERSCCCLWAFLLQFVSGIFAE